MVAKKKTPKRAAPKRKPVPKIPLKKALQTSANNTSPKKRMKVVKSVPRRHDTPVLCEKCLTHFPIVALRRRNDSLYCFRCVKTLVPSSKKEKVKAEPVPKKAKKSLKPTNVPNVKVAEKFNPTKKQWYAVQIYGNDQAVKKKILLNAREKGLSSLITRCIVPRVRVSVTRKNGKVVFQNKKAMPGYLLVRCQFTPDVQHCIENTKGMHVSEWREFREDGSKGPLHISSKAFSVVKVLPFSEKVKFESIQKGEKVPQPSPLPQEAIDKFGQKPRKVTPLHLGVNDYVQIMHGPYATTKGTVKEVIDHHLENPTAVVGFLLMGEKVEAKFQFSQLAKAF